MKRLLVAACVAATAAPVALAASAPTVTGFTAWSSAGARVGFVARTVDGRRGYLWTLRIGGTRPALLRSSPPVGLEEVDELAPGPIGSWGALQRSGTTTLLDVISSRGGGARVVTAAPVTRLLGDGSFLGFLSVTPARQVQLFHVVGAKAVKVADLAGATPPLDAVVGAGTLALREGDASVALYTLTGTRLAHVPANAASIALAPNRLVVRTRAKRLAVYGLRGGLVHDWKLGAASWTAGLATDGRYAVYLGANKAVRSVRLASGQDRVVARAASAFFFDGVALGPRGALAPLTSGPKVTLRLVPRAALG